MNEEDGAKLEVDVINATDDMEFLRFWATFEVTRRDESLFWGASSVFSPTERSITYALSPGTNRITIPLQIPLEPLPDTTTIGLSVFGGKSLWEPLFKSTRAHFALLPPIVITNILPVITNRLPVVTNIPPVFTNDIPIATNFPPVFTNRLPIVTNIPLTIISHVPIVHGASRSALRYR